MRGRTVTPAAATPRSAGLVWLPLVLAIVAAAPVLLVAGALLSAPPAGGPASVPDIPPQYLALYRAAAERYTLGADGWSILAAVGKVECDHGRSTLIGCHRGEANHAGARGPAQFLPTTWAAYRVDGDGDGDRDVYDAADAVFGMANYLRASGAPGDWRHALFAYNRADWYVDKVLAQASEYRAVSSASGTIVAGAGAWLVPLPGFPGERCDARIVPDVVALVRAFGIHVSDCFGGAPHALNGEHPLGLAIDASPRDGDWRRTEALARHLGWTEACAASGCPGRGPLRVVLYNGYPGHGDPRHSGTPHIHLSWHHGPAAPFARAPWVQVIAGARSRPRSPR
jgi:hypothetical protein